jgi:hydrogenase maturation protein HypF
MASRTCWTPSSEALRNEAPPLSRIDELGASFLAPNGFRSFDILHSEAVEGAFQPISPDVSICPDCLRELFDPSDRRYRYPFINCTNCGPRFTIIKDIPYDRPKTTMAPFAMCLDCEKEYSDPHRPALPCPAGRMSLCAGQKSGLRNVVTTLGSRTD